MAQCDSVIVWGIIQDSKSSPSKRLLILVQDSNIQNVQNIILFTNKTGRHQTNFTKLVPII